MSSVKFQDFCDCDAQENLHECTYHDKNDKKARCRTERTCLNCFRHEDSEIHVIGDSAGGCDDFKDSGCTCCKSTDNVHRFRIDTIVIDKSKYKPNVDEYGRPVHRYDECRGCDKWVYNRGICQMVRDKENIKSFGYSHLGDKYVTMVRYTKM